MDQPNLGIKISELRKAQGLTQKELVDKCNLNIRTLQRIESGEVTPRSFTLKLILETLDYSIEKSPTNDKDLHDGLNKKKPFQNKNILTTFFVLLGLLLVIGSYTLFKTFSSEVAIKDHIISTRNKITHWVNTKNLEAIDSIFMENACINQVLCGRNNIQKTLQTNFNNGYKILQHHIISISSNDSVVFEKYSTIYQYKGKRQKQEGLAEWHLTNKQWLIANETYAK